MANDSELADICGEYLFWDEAGILQEKPEISPCFLETALVWVPYGAIWVFLVPFLVSLARTDHRPPLPWTKLFIAKTLLNVLLLFLVMAEIVLTSTGGYRCDTTSPAIPAYYIGAAVRAATIVLVFCLEMYLRVLGCRSSELLFIHWFLLAVADLLQLYAVATLPVWCSRSYLYAVKFAVLWTQLILRGFADQYNDRGYNAFDDDNPCPEETASAFSTITFHWMTSLVQQCYKRTLTVGELWSQRRSLRSDYVVQRLLDNWNKAKQEAILKTELSRSPSSNFTISYEVKAQLANEKTPILENIVEPGYHGNSQVMLTQHRFSRRKVRPSLYWALAKSFGPIWVQAVFFKLLGDTVNLLQPLMIQKIIDIIETRNDPDVHTPAWMGITWAVGLTLTGFLKTLLWQRCVHLIFRFGLSVKTSLIGAIYRKSLTLSSAAKRSSTLGEIVSLMSVDCQRIQDGFQFSHFLVSIPFVVTIAMIQIWGMMGMSMFGGLAVVLVIIIGSFILGKLQQHLQKEILRLKSSRIKILNEIISGIKVLKMYTWEIPFQEKVSAIRWQEIRRLSIYAILSALSLVASVQGPFLILYALVVTYTLNQPVPYISPQMAIVTLSLVNIVRGPMILSSFVTTGLVQVYVSIGRIQEFLWKEEIAENSENQNLNTGYAIEINDGSFSWDVRLKPTLKNINLRIPEGGLYAVVGQVGVGKSSLISAVLGEIEKQKGTLSVKGSVAYVPQEAWIQNLTVRDNIVFGGDYDENRYNTVLSACALRADLDMLAGGDQTEIGEKGINISGGQKQRVSLARAVYTDADIYLLDDPLSAVDSHVGKFLFQNVISGKGLLKNKTRILVTHGIHWLPMVDKVLVLANGTICEAGSYEELMGHNGVLANLVQTYLEQGEESDEDDSSVLSGHKSKDELEADGNGTTTKRRPRHHSERESFGMSFSRPTSNNDYRTEKEEGGRLVKDEQSQEGGVKFYVFKTYMKAMGYFVLPLASFLMLAFQSFNVFSNYWLTYWTEDSLLRNRSLGHTDEYKDRYTYYLLWYTGLGVIQLVSVLTFAVLSLRRMVRASGILHNQMLACILRSPMAFFDTTPIGRIINRFSSDIDIMDDRLPLTFRVWNIQLFSMAATVIVVMVNTPIAIAAIVPVAIIYILLLRFFLPTAHQTKRMESVLRSPIYNHFSETVTGASVIRAYKCADRFIKESERRVDSNCTLFYAALSSGRWVSVRFESLGNLVILAAAIFALMSDDLSGGQAGLSVSYSLQITISLNLVVQAVSDMEMNIVSAERVTEYTKLEPEAEWVVASRRPSSDWPRSGALEFREYRTRYREGLELTLKGINCTIHSGEKVGIVGRTGAGKSSLALSLFRLIESAGGSILLDGRNVADIGLHDLRDKLTILPQDPVIFSGTLRENLDPFNKYDDNQMWRALECAHLKSAVERMRGQLNYECGEGGSNLSVGQRQLVCLARTLLHKTKVLILDEATSAVDLETDELIQATIRTEFSDCTILTIAHRLNTIMDYDRVMVLSEGRILELDSPATLLANPDGVFYKMARDAGLV